LSATTGFHRTQASTATAARRPFQRLYFGTTVAFVVAGCSKGGVGALKKIKEEACACKTKACAEAVDKKMDAALSEIAKNGEPSEADGKEIMSLMADATICTARLM
jgi:chemotaxis response regulator CheB